MKPETAKASRRSLRSAATSLCLFMTFLNISAVSPALSSDSSESFLGEQRERPVPVIPAVASGKIASVKKSLAGKDWWQKLDNPLSRPTVDPLLQMEEEENNPPTAEPTPVDLAKEALEEFKKTEAPLILAVVNFINEMHHDTTVFERVLSHPADLGVEELCDDIFTCLLPRSPAPLILKMRSETQDDGGYRTYAVQVMNEDTSQPNSILVLGIDDYKESSEGANVVQKKRFRYNPEGTKLMISTSTTFDPQGHTVSRNKRRNDQEGRLERETNLTQAYNDKGLLTLRLTSTKEFKGGESKAFYESRDSYEYDATGRVIHEESESKKDDILRMTKTLDTTFNVQGQETSFRKVTATFNEKGEENRKESILRETQYTEVTGKLRSESVSTEVTLNGKVFLTSLNKRLVTYNSQGNSTEDKVTFSVNGVTETMTSRLMTYDETGRLALRETSTQNGRVLQQINRQYDPQGHLTQEEEIRYSEEAENAIDSRQTSTFSYDLQGNKISEQILEEWDFERKGPQSFRKTQRTFNTAGQVTSVKISFRYDHGKEIFDEWHSKRKIFFHEIRQTEKGTTEEKMDYDEAGILRFHSRVSTSDLAVKEDETSYDEKGRKFFHGSSRTNGTKGTTTEKFVYDATGALKSYSRVDNDQDYIINHIDPTFNIVMDPVIEKVSSKFDPRFSTKGPDPGEKELEQGLLRRVTTKSENFHPPQSIDEESFQEQYTLDETGEVSKMKFIYTKTDENSENKNATYRGSLNQEANYEKVPGLIPRLKLVSVNAQYEGYVRDANGSSNISEQARFKPDYDVRGRPREITTSITFGRRAKVIFKYAYLFNTAGNLAEVRSFKSFPDSVGEIDLAFFPVQETRWLKYRSRTYDSYPYPQGYPDEFKIDTTFLRKKGVPRQYGFDALFHYDYNDQYRIIGAKVSGTFQGPKDRKAIKFEGNVGETTKVAGLLGQVVRTGREPFMRSTSLRIMLKQLSQDFNKRKKTRQR